MGRTRRQGVIVACNPWTEIGSRSGRITKGRPVDGRRETVEQDGNGDNPIYCPAASVAEREKEGEGTLLPSLSPERGGPFCPSAAKPLRLFAH